MDEQNPQQQNNTVNSGNRSSASIHSHKSGCVIGRVVNTPRTRNNVDGLDKKKAEGALHPKYSEGRTEDGSTLTLRVDSSGIPPLACNRTPNIGGNNMNVNASANQIVFGNSDADCGAEGSGTSRQGGSGRTTPVAPANRKVSHSPFSTGMVTRNIFHNTARKLRPLKQPGNRADDTSICGGCVGSEDSIESSCPKCGKHNNEKTSGYVPGEPPDVCLPVNDEIASGSVPGSTRIGSASGRFNPESPIPAEEARREFQYTSDHGAPGSQQAASERAQIAVQLRGRFGNHAPNRLNSERNAAPLASGQNTESEIQRSRSTDMEGSNLKSSIPGGSISTQHPNSSRRVTLRMKGFGNGMHSGETCGFLGNLSRGIQSNFSASLSQLENNNSVVNSSIGVGVPVSPTSGFAGTSAIRWLFAGGSSILNSKRRRRRIDLGTGTGSRNSGASGRQQGMQTVAPSMPSGRHSTGGNFANAYADASGGGHPGANDFVTNANGYPSANSVRYPGNASGGYPNGIYPNGWQSSAGTGSHGIQRKGARISDPAFLITHNDFAGVGDDENKKNNATRESKSAQAMLSDKELEERATSNSQNVDTQSMDRQNVGLTGYSYEQVVSNPVLYYPLRNQVDAQAGSVQGMQSGMQGMEDYPGMNESGIESQAGSENMGSQIGSQNMRGGRKSEKRFTLGSAMSGKISAQGLISTLKGLFRGDRKSTENANSVNGQRDSFKEQKFQNQAESSSASRSPPRPPTGSPQQSFPENGATQQMQMQSSVHMLSTRTPSMHTPIVRAPNIPPTSVHMPTANNMYNEQVAQQQPLALQKAQQQAQQQHLADAVAQQQLKMAAKRKLEVEQAKVTNMAIIRASQKHATAPRNSRKEKSDRGSSPRQDRAVLLARQGRAGTSPRQERDGNRDETIAALQGQERKSSKGCKSKNESAKRSSQQKEQEQNAFKEQQQEAGFSSSKQDGSNKQDGSVRLCSRGPRDVPVRDVSHRTASARDDSNMSLKEVSTDTRGNPEDGGWANVPAGANGTDVAVVNGNNMNFGDGMDNGLNFNGIYGMSTTVSTKRKGVPSQKRNNNKDANHTGADRSPYGNNTQSNEEYEDYRNDLLNTVDLNKVIGWVNNSEATNDNKTLNSVNAVNSLRSVVPANDVNANVEQLQKQSSYLSSIQGDSLVEVNRTLDELEEAKERELLVYSRCHSDSLRRELSVNDPLRADAYYTDHTDYDEATFHYSEPESGISDTSLTGASGGPQSASGSQPPHSGSQHPNHSLSGRNVENRMELGIRGMETEMGW